MRRVLVLLALVLTAATGTAVAGGLLTGADIRNGSLAGADFAPLHVKDFEAKALEGPRGKRGQRGEPGPPGPTAPAGPPPFIYDRADATIGADGVVTDGALTGVTVSHPATGVYCFEKLSASFIQVESEEIASPKVVAWERINTDSSTGPCPAEAGYRVAVFNAAGVPTNGAFHLIVS